MAVTGKRAIGIQLEDDVLYQQSFLAADAGASPGVNTIQSLASGNNTITVPSGAVGVTIVKPSNNTYALVLKGVNGDTGIALSKTDPDSISLLSVSSFVINAAGTVILRFIFT